MRENILFPASRLVMGSLYKADTKGFGGVVLPTPVFWFNVAIEKGNEKHWNETDWGRIIRNVGEKGFPKGQYNNANFAWKIIDGDSVEVNMEGNKPCDHEGYAGCWVLRFKSHYAPKLFNLDASPLTLPEFAINTGDYIQIYGTVVDNASDLKPGVHLNFSHIAFVGYGQRIESASIDAKDIGFGKGIMPKGVSRAPVVKTESATPPPPHDGILTTKIMLPTANGMTYENYKAVGWTDEQLIANGLMNG